MDNPLTKSSICKFSDEAEARKTCTQVLWKRLFRGTPPQHVLTPVIDPGSCVHPPVVEARVTTAGASPKSVRSTPPPRAASSAVRECGSAACDRYSLECPARAAPAALTPVPVASPNAVRAGQSVETHEHAPGDWGDAADAAVADGSTRSASPPARQQSSNGTTLDEEHTVEATPVLQCQRDGNGNDAAGETPTADNEDCGGARLFRETESFALAEAEYEVPSPSSIQRRTFLSRKRERTPSALPAGRDGLVFSPRVRIGRGRGESASVSICRPSLVQVPPRARAGGSVFIAGPDGLVRTPSPAPRESVRVAEEEAADRVVESAGTPEDHVASPDAPSPHAQSVSGWDARGEKSGSHHHEENAERPSEVVDMPLFAQDVAEEVTLEPSPSLPCPLSSREVCEPTPLPPVLRACEEVPVHSVPVVALFAEEEVLSQLRATEWVLPQLRAAEWMPPTAVEAAVDDVEAPTDVVPPPSRLSIDFTSFEWVQEAEATLLAQQRRVASVSPVPVHPDGPREASRTRMPSHSKGDSEDGLFSLPHVSFRSVSGPPPAVAAAVCLSTERSARTFSRSPCRGVSEASPTLAPSASSPPADGHLAVSEPAAPHECVASTAEMVQADREPSASPRPRDQSGDEAMEDGDQRVVPHEASATAAGVATAFRFVSRVGTRLAGGAAGAAHATRRGSQPSAKATSAGRRVKPSLLPSGRPMTGGGRDTSVSQPRAQATTTIVPAPPRLATSERVRRGKRARTAGGEHHYHSTTPHGHAARPSVQFELPKTLSASSVRMAERPVNVLETAKRSDVGGAKTRTLPAPLTNTRTKKRKRQ